MLTIVIRELRDNVLSMRFILAFILCLVVIPLSLYVGVRDYTIRQEHFRQLVETNRKKMPGFDIPDLEFQAEGYRAPSELGGLVHRLEWYLPQRILTRHSNGYQFQFQPIERSDETLLFGQMDFQFIVVYILSLLGLLFSYNAVTGEKELGTLRLSLSNTLSRTGFLAGKIAGNFLACLIPILTGIVIGFLILGITGLSRIFSGETLIRTGLIFLAAILFITVMYLLGILFSSLTHRSITAILSLLLAWVILVMILPGGSAMLAKVIYPIPDKQVVDLRLLMIRREIEQ